MALKKKTTGKKKAASVYAEEVTSNDGEGDTSPYYDRSYAYPHTPKKVPLQLHAGLYGNT